MKYVLFKYIASLFYVRWLLSLFRSYRLDFSLFHRLFINVFAMPLLVIARLMIKNDTTKTTYYHGTIQ